MEELLKKLSSYNILNNLLPGVSLLALSPKSELAKFATENALTGLLLCYVLGVIIGRIGSLVLEPVFKKIAKHEPYQDFISASQEDDKIDLLSETNNTYRSLASAAFCFIVIITVNAANKKWWHVNFESFWVQFSLGLLVLILFIFSYKKQTGYISKRIRKLCDNEAKKP